MNDIVECNVNGENISLCIDDIDTKADYWDNVEMWRAEGYSTYESETIEWIDRDFKSGEVIYDIGANIGQYSLYTAKHLKNNCKILAFEPESLNYAKLNKNIVANGLSRVILPYCFAITDETKIDVLKIHSFRPGAAFHTFGDFPPQTASREPSSSHRQGIIGISIDDLVDTFHLPFPNHIKIDVDGSESMVIKGSHRILEDVRLKSVMIEVYLDKDLDVFFEIRDVFLERDFDLINENSLEDKIGKAPNFIFKRK